MGTLKTLISTTIIGAPTSTTLYTIEPTPEIEESKKEVKKGIKGIGQGVKNMKDSFVGGVKSKAKKTTKVTDKVELNKRLSSYVQRLKQWNLSLIVYLNLKKVTEINQSLFIYSENILLYFKNIF